MLDVVDLARSYGPLIPVLQSVSFRASAGDCVALVGPSGVGKSTLLRLIAGLEEPSSGEVRIDGRNLRQVPPHRRGVALVPQHAALFPHWTVRKNLALGLPPAGPDGAKPRDAIDRMAARLGISDLLERRPIGLSGGQSKRVALGRALLARPGILLLDEPFGSLDAPLRMDLGSLLAQLLADSPELITILVTHELADALSFGTQLLVLMDGVVAQWGEPRAVYRHPATIRIAEFLGDPPCSFLAVELVETGGRLEARLGDSGSGSLLADAHRWLPAGVRRPGTWRVGIQPERVAISRGGSGNPTPGTVRIPGTLAAVLPRGPATLLEARLASGGTAPIRAWAAPDSRWRPGESVGVCIDLAHSNWFDPETGRLLTS